MVQLHWDYLDARGQVQSKKKPLILTKVERLLKNRNISRSKIKVKLLQSICEHCLARRSESLALSQKVCKSCVFLRSHLLMLLLMARSVCSMISSTEVSGTAAEHELQDKGQESQLNERFSSLND